MFRGYLKLIQMPIRDSSVHAECHQQSPLELGLALVASYKILNPYPDQSGIQA